MRVELGCISRPHRRSSVVNVRDANVCTKLELFVQNRPRHVDAWKKAG